MTVGVTASGGPRPAGPAAPHGGNHGEPRNEDGAESLQAKETHDAVPFGVWALFGGLILWGVWYFVSYVGWDQTAEVTSGDSTAIGTNIGSTIFFTVAATAAAIGLAVGMARRARARR